MIDPREQLQSSLGSAYTLDRELGGGGMSRTYLATENALARRVVVKILAPELLANISVERFKREVLLAAQLQHPHVVPVLASGDADGLPWFTMPYVEGESLRTRLARGPLRISEVTGILKDVARALEFAHGHKIVHRDIKPDNVLLAGSSATVTDFGIAKAITAARTDSGMNPTLTGTGQSIGTPAYMAPEQAAGDPDVDHRADIYAYGAMAYELLAGRPPFSGTSAARIITAHFSEAPRPIAELRSDTPPLLADLVMRCLEKDVSRRPQTASDLVRVLDAVTSSGATDAAPAVLLGANMRLGRAFAIWGAAALVVALTAWAATAVIGLPDWVFPGSLGVMLAGLPVIAVTWYVQRATRRAYTATPAYTPGGSPSGHSTIAALALKASPHVSWRRTWMGGAIAVGAFAVLVIAFMVMRALGIGPAASLLAAGKLEEQGTLVVADFRGPPGDSTLGSTVAEALRTDLGQSSSLRVMTRASVREILRLMQRPPESDVDFTLAREIATREGAKALLDGEVVTLGGSYVVSARLVSAIDGTELAVFRRTAAAESELVGALGRLSRDIRGKIGESLKDIRDTKALERVTTPSLAALRKYVEGVRLSDEVGDTERGLAALEEAVSLDTAFAMAWRKIAVVVGNAGTDRLRQMQAASRAFRHRERLSETERLLTEAYYYTAGPEPDRDRALAAYEALLESDPNNATAANNAGVLYMTRREWAKAAQAYRKATEEKRPFGASFTNLMDAQLRLGQVAAAESTAQRFRQRLPDYDELWEADWYVRWGRGDLDGADSVALATFRSTNRMVPAMRSAFNLSGTALMRGKVREGLRWNAEEHNAAFRATRAPDRPLRAAIDSARVIAFFLDDSARARGLIRAALQRNPVAEMAPPARPWNELAQLGAAMRNAQLAKEAVTGFERDIAELGLINPTAQRARMRAWSAIAAGDYRSAIADLVEADRGLAIDDRRADIALADAFDLSGQPDSALKYYEEFLTTPDDDTYPDAFYRAGALKRAGELYEARGDTAKAEAHYSNFVDLWKAADPELQPKVREVKDRLARLRRQRG
jgi:eukaryotic-like serine/threonine-protein kinase